MAVVVLLALLFQSVHSYEHISKLLSEKKCLHNQASEKEITHQHQDFEHCLFCDFILNDTILKDVAYINFDTKIVAIKISFSNSKQITQFFRGSLFSLRAPPSFIV